MTYSGWKNWETWNVGLWMANDEGLYGIALESKDYATFQETMRELDSTETPDGVAYNDSGLDISALDAAIVEMRAD